MLLKEPTPPKKIDALAEIEKIGVMRYLRTASLRKAIRDERWNEYRRDLEEYRLQQKALAEKQSKEF